VIPANAPEFTEQKLTLLFGFWFRRFAGNVRGKPAHSRDAWRRVGVRGRWCCASPPALVRPPVSAASLALTSGLLRLCPVDAHSDCRDVDAGAVLLHADERPA